MSVTAVIYLTDAASRHWALSSVAGRSVLLRVLMTAARAGASRIGLPRALADEPVLSEIRRHPELARAVFPLEGQSLGTEPLLLLPAHGVVDAASLRRLVEAGQRGLTVALEESKGSLAPLLMMAAEQARGLMERLVMGLPIGEELESQVRRGRITLVAGEGYFVPVTDAGSRREAETALYRGLGTEADSLVDRIVNRPCSLLLTRLLVRLPVTPNMVSLLSLAFGLAATWQFWFATPGSALLGLLFFMLSVIVDHVDGDIARLTYQESTVGRWLDLAVDTLNLALLTLAMAGTASAVGGPLMFVGGGVAACGVVMSSLFTNAALPRMERSRVLRALGSRDPFSGVLVGFIVLLWKAPGALPYLVAVLALGTHAFWLSYLLPPRRRSR